MSREQMTGPFCGTVVIRFVMTSARCLGRTQIEARRAWRRSSLSRWSHWPKTRPRAAAAQPCRELIALFKYLGLKQTQSSHKPISHLDLPAHNKETSICNFFCWVPFTNKIMFNHKKNSVAAQLASRGPTKGQQRIARQVQRYDDLVKKGPPSNEEAARAGEPPTKRERKIARALQHQANLVRRENRQANRGNIVALLDATKSSRPLTVTGHLQFYGDITIQHKDKAIHTAAKASAAVFISYHRVLFVSGVSVKGGKCKQLKTATAGPAMRSAGAAVVYKMATGNNNNADQFWEKNLYGLGTSPRNPTHQSIEASVRSIAEALVLVAIQMACAKDDEMPRNDESPIRPKVTIFTDSQAAMSEISNINLTARQLEGKPGLGRLIVGSVYLHHIGVDVELYWSPRHQSEGNKRAEVASRRAATSHGTFKSGDSLDVGLKTLIDSLEHE